MTDKQMIKEFTTVANIVEFGGVIVALGKRVTGVTSVRVFRGSRGRKNIETHALQAGIIAFDLTDAEIMHHGLLYVKDLGCSGHKVYVIA